MGGWMVGWRAGWMVDWLDGWMVGEVDGWLVGEVDGWVGGWMENNPAEKDLGTLECDQRDVSWQCALTAQKAKCLLGCGLTEGTLPLCSALLSPRLRPALGSPARDRQGPARAGTEKATEMVRGLLQLRRGERLRESGLLSPEKRWRASCGRSILKGARQEEGERLFPWSAARGPRGNGLKLPEGRVRVDTRVGGDRRRLPGEARPGWTEARSNLTRWEMSLPRQGGWAGWS